MSQVGVGIIGAGRMGRIHAEALTRTVPAARLVAVADVVEEAAKKLALEVGVESTYTDFLRLVENREVQAIVVTVPTSQKVQIIKAASLVGKHVFCEKPIATTLQDADQILKFSQKSAGKFQVGYQRRFDPAHAKAKRMLESGEIGEPVLVRTNTRDPLSDPTRWPDPKVSGGIFLDTCTHDYDVVRWLCRSEVSRVAADGSPRGQPDQHTAVTNLTLANGALAQVDATRMAQYGYDVRLEIVGTKASVFVDTGREGETKVMTNGWQSNTLYPSYAERFKEAYRLEMASFIDSIVHDTDPKVSAEDGRAAVEIAVAAKRSMTEGKSVSLPL